MGLFDELDDMTVKQLHKSEMGDNRIFGTVIGTVTNHYSKDMPGRICVQIPNRDKEANVLKWARLAMPYIGKKYGIYFVPEVGDQVLVVFEDGNIEKPFIIGCVPTANSTFVSQNGDEQNQYKTIQTKNGNTIALVDHQDGDGEKDKITIKTSGAQLQLALDNENHKISLADKGKKNKVEMNTENGTLTICVEKKLSIKVGDIELSMNGESGKVSLKCGKLKESVSDSIKIETQGMYKVEAENAAITGNSTCKTSGGSTMVVEGQIIKMG